MEFAFAAAGILAAGIITVIAAGRRLERLCLRMQVAEDGVAGSSAAVMGMMIEIRREIGVFKEQNRLLAGAVERLEENNGEICRRMINQGGAAEADLTGELYDGGGEAAESGQRARELRAFYEGIGNVLGYEGKRA